MRYAFTVASLLVVISLIARAQSASCPNGTYIPDQFCIQGCNNTNCNMSCSNITGTCLQQCQDFGSCPAVNCNSSGQCQQLCSKDCGSVTCTAENCTQSCQGSCKKITCDSKRCTQVCGKGGCIMECTDKAQSCQQVCTKDCTFICNAKDPATQCQQTCQQGGCKTEGTPRNKTTCDAPFPGQQGCTQSGCPYQNCYMECSNTTISQDSCNQFCRPPGIPCPKAMTCDTDNCTQTCLGDCESAECGSSTMCLQQCGGKCKSTRCTSKICNQYCLDGACALDCADGTEMCSQICNGTSCASLISKASKVEMQFCLGNCDHMQCNSPNCTQKCGGNCPKMTCNGDWCDQECIGESCEMHCPKSVKSCTQTCKKGKCKLLCEAENCKKNCTESAECSEIQPTTIQPTTIQPTTIAPKSSGALFRLDLILLVNGVFLAILGVLLK